MLSKMYSIRTLDSIKSIKMEEWDVMIDDNIFASYGWLKTVEEMFIENIKSKYYIFEDESTLKGAAVCYYQDKNNNIETVDDLLLGRFKRYINKLGISFMPTLICCPLFCYGKHFLTQKNLNYEESESITIKLLQAIELTAKEKKLSLAFLNIMDKEDHLIKLLNNRHYSRVTHMPLSYIDIKWASFEGYLNHIKNIRRGTTNAVKNEINRNRKKGVTITPVEDLKKYENRLYKLLKDNYYRYNKKPFMFKETFLTKLKENIGDDVRFYISIKNKVLSGVSILFKKHTTGFGFKLGVDHEIAGNDFTYFNIAYYRPIMDAISEGMTKLYFGPGMYEPKIRRGCDICDVHLYYKPVNKLKNIPLKLWFFIFSLWMKYKLPKQQEEDSVLKTTNTHNGKK